MDFSDCMPVWKRQMVTMTGLEYDLLNAYISAAPFTQRLFRDMFSRCAHITVKTDERLHTQALEVTELEQTALACIRGTTDGGRLLMRYILAPTREQIEKYKGRWSFPTIAELEEDERQRNRRTIEGVKIKHCITAPPDEYMMLHSLIE